MMTHRSKKPFECKVEGCDKSYCDARSLRRHLENHHQQLQDQIGGQGDGEPEYGGTGYFQFDSHYRQQILNNGKGDRGFDPSKSPGYLAQVSPVTPTSPHPRNTLQSLLEYVI